MVRYSKYLPVLKAHHGYLPKLLQRGRSCSLPPGWQPAAFTLHAVEIISNGEEYHKAKVQQGGLDHNNPEHESLAHENLDHEKMEAEAADATQSGTRTSACDTATARYLKTPTNQVNDTFQLPQAPSNNGNDPDQRRHKASKSKTQAGSGSAVNAVLPYIKLLMLPASENLQLLQAATKVKQPDKKSRAAMLKTQLLHVGDLVMKNVAVLHSTDRVWIETVFWDHVVKYWPNPGTNSSQVRGMYLHLKGAQKEDEVPEKREIFRFRARL
ncbi:MAG: hypothetical protein Q9169_003728 [Polycauliona sp. 2 TL-2023]